MDNKCFITVDFEDWFHLPYLNKYNFKPTDYSSYCSQTLDFFIFLKVIGIYATVFVVADCVEQHAETIKKISDMGHEIACHSLHHESVNQQDNTSFENDTREAKTKIENVIGKKIYGFRAPSFSMTNEKLLILEKIGFSYDASYIQSKANEYYNVMDSRDFVKIESLVYKVNNLFEFETPTYNFYGKKIPFAGGGFFRLYPFALFKSIFSRYTKTNPNFMFFIHPYEIVGTKFPGTKKINFKDRFRINIRRKSVVKRFKKMLSLLKGFKFYTYTNYIKEGLNNEL